MGGLGGLTRERIVAFLSSVVAFTVVLAGAVYLADTRSVPSPPPVERKTHVTLEVPPEAINIGMDARIRAEGLLGSPLIPVALVPAAPRSVTRIIVLEGDPDASNTTFTVLFRPLSPFTTGTDGIMIQPATADWLKHFGDALPECGIDRVKVTGHASKRGFGSPLHRNIWDKVVPHGSVEESKMNCGLANVRAHQVASLLHGESDPDDRVQKAVTALRVAKELSPVAARDQASPAIVNQATVVRDLLTELCSKPKTAGEAEASLRAEIHAWDDPRGEWAWLPNATTGALARSAHITLPGVGHLDSCPELLRGHVLPLRIDNLPW